MIVPTLLFLSILGSVTPQYITNLDLVPLYPFVTHLPAGSNPPSNPPLLLFLPGKGSRGPPADIVALSQYNGPGRRLMDYYGGNMSVSAVMVAEQFLTVIPIAPLDNATFPEYDLGGISAVYAKVKSLYTFDESRVYISGYSMGARDSWKYLFNAISEGHPFAAAAISAGEPDVGTVYTPILTTPIRHYAGTMDYEISSSVAVANVTQKAIVAAGGTDCTLTIIPGPYPLPAHNEMGDAPFYEDMFTWLLAQKLATNESTTSSSSSTSSSSATLTSASIASTASSTASSVTSAPAPSTPPSGSSKSSVSMLILAGGLIGSALIW